MSKWNKKLVKILTAASLAASLAFCAPCTQLGAFAATSVTDGVMIRNDATTEAGIIGSLNEGDEVTILDVLQSGDGYAWYYIQLENGNKGYVRSDLISADDSELAAFRTEEPEEEPQEEAPAEPAEEEAQPEEQTQEEAPAEAATAAAPETAEAVTTAQGYDAYSDPSANIVARFETDENGEGNWYVFNDDNGTRIRIRDLRDTEAAPAAAGTPGIWRPLAIIFGLLALAFAALALYLIKSIQDSRTKSSRRRALEAAREEDGEEEEEDEFYFEDDEPDTEPDYEDEDEEEEDASSDDSEVTDSTIEAGDPEEAEVTEIPAEEIEAAIAAETEQIEKSVSEDEAPSAEEVDEEVYSDAEELAEEDLYEEEPAEEVLAAEEEPEVSANPDKEYFDEDADFREVPAEETAEDSDAVYAESEDYEEESGEEDGSEEEDYTDEDSEDEDGDYDEDYDDDDYDDEDYEDEDYDEDDEDDERGSRSKEAKKGGLFGFISKLFGSSSKEDEDEGEDFDDEEDETPTREFDEFKEYPEDIDLLPRDDYDDKDDLEEDMEEGSYDEESSSARDRLTMQKVMKNVDYREVETDFSDEDMDGLFDDDDDMEYSFISSTRRK